MRVLITGCSRGIGRATVSMLMAQGHEVVATAVDPSSLTDLRAARSLALDVTDPESVRRAVDQAGPLDALVNNAGVGVRGPVETLSAEGLAQAFAVNVFGSLRMIQAVLPQMRGRHAGRIVNVSSVAGRRSMPLVGHYAATKHALEALSEALRYELIPWNIPVTLIEPAGVSTRFSAHRIGPDADSRVLAAYSDVIAKVEEHAAGASGPSATAEDVARTICAVLDSAAPPLRLAPSVHAQSMIDRRRMTDDDTWERELMAEIGLRPTGVTQESRSQA